MIKRWFESLIILVCFIEQDIKNNWVLLFPPISIFVFSNINNKLKEFEGLEE